MKALIVTRFSDDKQKGGTSTEVQTQTCQRYCKEKGFEVIGQLNFKAQSAKASNTQRVQKLLEFCKKHQGKADALVVYKLDRFARDMGLHYYLKSQLLKLNITLQSATEPIDNSPAGKFTENMLAAVAQFDNDQKAERVTSALRNKCENGIWPWKTPLGYLNTRTENEKAGIAKIDDKIAHHIQNIFEFYASGQMGIVELSQYMQQQAIIHSQGKSKGKPVKFSPQTVHNVLTNKFYIGILEVKKWDEQFNGAHKPLIDAETWQKCQARLYPPKEEKMTRKRINPDFPLKDNLMCGHCMRKMTAAWAKGKREKYAYYYCTHSDCSNTGKKAIGKIEFENQFMDYLNLLRPDETMQNDLHKRLLGRYEQRKDEFETDASRHRKRLDLLEKQKQNLVGAMADGADRKDVIPAINKIKDDIALVKLAINESHLGEFEMELMLQYADKFFERMAMLWFDSPIQQKIQLQRVLFPDGIIYSYDEGFSNTKLRPYIRLMYQSKSTFTTAVTPRGIEPRFPG